jgi:hypothetical protein
METVRLKPLAVEIFGRTRELGVFPSKLHTDILSVRSLITRALEPCQNRPFPLRLAGIPHDSPQPAD